MSSRTSGGKGMKKGDDHKERQVPVEGKRK